MAKLFYTIDEAATRLGKSEADLQAMVDSGQLEEFKMHDQVHFKRAVIDQLVDDDVINLDLPLDDDFDLGDSKAPAPPALSLNDASGSAIIDDLKFDDDFAPTAPTAPTAAASPSMGLDLGLDDLDLSDSAKDMPGIPVVPAISTTPKIVTTPPNNDEPLGLLDSADASAIAPAVKAKSSDDLDLDLDLGLDLDLDLGMDDSKPNKPAVRGIDILGDSRGDSAAAMAASDASGSMAPPTRKPKSTQLDEDYLDVGAMTGSGSLSLETVGSGSGMLDDSTDSDQSSVGAALLDDGGDDTFGTGASLGGGSGLFAEPTEMDGFDQENSSVPMAASSTGGGMVAMQAERVDSAMSGMGLGLMVGTLVAIILATLVVMGTRMGGGSALAGMITQDLMMWCGGLAIATLLAGGIGFFVGKSIE